jgi:hypothetical protein
MIFNHFMIIEIKGVTTLSVEGSLGVETCINMALCCRISQNQKLRIIYSNILLASNHIRACSFVNYIGSHNRALLGLDWKLDPCIIANRYCIVGGSG